jgi:hypothetical protein
MKREWALKRAAIQYLLDECDEVKWGGPGFITIQNSPGWLRGLGCNSGDVWSVTVEIVKQVKILNNNKLNNW